MAAEIRALDRQYHDPNVIKELERITRCFPNMAVLLYSRTGSYTLEDADMQKADKIDVSFLRKNRTVHFEREIRCFAVEKKEVSKKSKARDIESVQMLKNGR